MSYRKNRAGNTLVVDRLIELYGSSTASTVRSLIAQRTSTAQNTADSYYNSMTVEIVGTREVGLSSITLYLQASVDGTAVTDYSGISFSWTRPNNPDGWEEATTRSITVTADDIVESPEVFNCTLTYTDSLGNTRKKIASCQIAYATIRQYQWTNATTEDALNKADSAWSTSMGVQPDNVTYLWIRESEDGGETWTYYRMTGVNGEDGIGIRSTEVEYALSNSEDEAPTGEWTTERPSRGEGQVLWMRIKITYTDGTIEYFDAIPVTGDAGNSSVVSVQYAWGPSTTVPPMECFWFWDKKFYLWKGTFITHSAAVWSDTKPSKPDGEWYLWIRFSYDGGVTWDEPICLNTSSADFSIDGSATWSTNRGVTTVETTLTYIITRQGTLTGDISWTVESDGDVVSLTYDGDVATVVIPYGTDISTFTVTATIGTLTRSKIVQTVDVEASIEYLGVYPRSVNGVTIDKPTTAKDGKPLVEGDHITYISDEGTDVYVWVEDNSAEGGHWTNTLSDFPEDYLYQIAMDSLYDITSMAASGEDMQPITQGSAWAFVTNIAAVNAFIENVFAQNIKLGGVIYGGGYSVDGINDGTAGFHLRAETGILQAYGAIFKDVTIASNDDTGQLILETRKRSAGDPISYEITLTRFSESELVDFVGPAESGTLELGGTTYYYDKIDDDSETVIASDGQYQYQSQNNYNENYLSRTTTLSYSYTATKSCKVAICLFSGMSSGNSWGGRGTFTITKNDETLLSVTASVRSTSYDDNLVNDNTQYQNGYLLYGFRTGPFFVDAEEGDVFDISVTTFGYGYGNSTGNSAFYVVARYEVSTYDYDDSILSLRESEFAVDYYEGLTTPAVYTFSNTGSRAVSDSISLTGFTPTPVYGNLLDLVDSLSEIPLNYLVGCESGSTFTYNGVTYEITQIMKMASYMTVYTNSRTFTFALSADESVVASDGWYTQFSLYMIAYSEISALYVGTMMPAGDYSSMGTLDEHFPAAYFDSLYFDSGTVGGDLAIGASVLDETAGYSMLPNGLMLQWGILEATSDASAVAREVTFPVAFSDTPYWAFASQIYSTTSDANYYGYLCSTSGTTIEGALTATTARFSTYGTMNLLWLAIGPA